MFRKTTILEAFEATGLSPFDPAVILQRFNNKQPTSGNSSDSGSSAFSGSDWRKIERLQRQVVADQGDEQVKRLSQVLHSNSVQNSPLEDEIDRLREAPVKEGTLRKRGQPFLLQRPEEYHGGAVFWLPRKVREACARQVITERDVEKEKQKKTERAEFRAANKLLEDNLDRQKQERSVEREDRNSQ